MRYFLTGGTGFIGGEIARQLRARGDEVVALARTPHKAADLAALGCDVVEGDITDRRSLPGPMEGVDGVFHVAAWYKIGADASRAHAINVEGTRNVLETMRALDVGKGVYTSTLAVFSDTHGHTPDESYRYDGPHLSAYDRTKWAAHYEVAQPMIDDGLPLVIVQPGAVYGPGDTSTLGALFEQWLQGQLPMLPQQTAFCWAHVEDVAHAHLLAMDSGTPGESYIIAGPCHTLIEAFDVAAEVAGRPAPRLHVPPAVLKALAVVAELLGRVVPLPDMFSAETLRVTAGTTYLGDNSKARRELGYDPRPLADGLAETLDALRARTAPP